MNLLSAYPINNTDNIQTMSSQLQRRFLAEQVADALRGRLAEGEWSGVMPPYRAMRTLLQVGRGTLEEAYKILEKDGILLTRPKRRALILKKPRGKPGHIFRKVAWLQGKPFSEFSGSEVEEVMCLQVALLEAGMEFELILLPPGRRHFKTSILKRHIRNRKASHWILSDQPVEILEWFVRQNQKACMIGTRPASAAKLSSLDLGRPAAVRHACGMLQRLGHNRITLLSPKSVSFEIRAVEEAFSNAPTTPHTGLEIARHDATTVGLAAKLERVFQIPDSRPDALIVSGAAHAITAHSFLLSNPGIRLGHNLSFLSLDYDSSFDHLLPRPAHYSLGKYRLMRRLFRLVCRLDHATHPARFTLTPELVEGETLRPVD